MPLLCTVAEALDITRATVSESDITSAHYELECTTGRLILSEADGVFNTLDAAWLKRAIAFQAELIAGRPSKNLTVDAQSISEDGASVTPNSEGLVIAPMARLALKNVTWVGARTVSTVGSERASSVYSLDSFPEIEWH